jgi:hypothetical protein
MANFGNGVWIVESDGTDNDDWISDHSGDPENLDASAYTQGDDAIYLNHCEKPKIAPKFNFSDIQDIYQASSLDASYSLGHFEYEIEFKHSSNTFSDLEQKMADIQDFMLNHSSSAHNATYLVIRRGTDGFIKFPDGSGTPGNRNKYIKGRMTGIKAEIEGANFYIKGKLKFRSVLD